MAIGMTLIGAGVIWATQVPVHGHFLAEPRRPVPRRRRRDRVRVHPDLDRRARRRRGAPGRARLRAAEHLAAARRRDRDRDRLERRGQPHQDAAPRRHRRTAALTGGFQCAFWVLGAIALLALPAIFMLVRRDEPHRRRAKTTLREAQPALAAELTHTQSKTRRHDMPRQPINPWPWSEKLRFDQAELIHGHQRQLVCSGQDAVDAGLEAQHPRDIWPRN